MTGWNMPPGCSTNDIPGNDAESEKWEQLTETVLEDAKDLSPEDAYLAWKMGLNAFWAIRDNKFMLQTKAEYDENRDYIRSLERMADKEEN